jgi:hypothetical protein
MVTLSAYLCSRFSSEEKSVDQVVRNQLGLMRNLAGHDKEFRLQVFALWILSDALTAASLPPRNGTRFVRDYAFQIQSAGVLEQRQHFGFDVIGA